MSALTPSDSAERPTLTYSYHAIERALCRKLPILSCLPPAARLADRDTGGAVYKVSSAAGESFYLILSEENVVVTTFRKQDDAEWQRWMQARQRRREREERGLMAMFSPIDDPLQEAREAEYAACRLLRSAFSGSWQERFDSRLARRFSQPPHPRQVRAGQMRLLWQAEKEGVAAARQVH